MIFLILLMHLNFLKIKLIFQNGSTFDFQQLLDLSDLEVSPFQGYQVSSLLMKAEKILSQEMPIIPLFYSPMQASVRIWQRNL